MDSTNVTGNWDEQKGILKQKIADLTNDEMMFTDDKKDEMYGNLEIRLSKSKEELRQIIDPI